MIIKQPAFYDVSHWKEILDFNKVDPKPFLFGTKATESVSFVDGKFVRFFEGMKEIGVHRLAYHFHRKNADPELQAAHFCNTIRPHITVADVLAWDVEEGGETAEQLKTGMEYIQRQFPDNLLLIYSRKNLLDSIPMFMRRMLAAPFSNDKLAFGSNPLNAIEMTADQKAYFRNIKVWTAGYPYDPDLYDTIPDYYKPDRTKWGPTWAWQYSNQGTVSGIDGNVDLNFMHQDFVDYLNSQEPNPPPPPSSGGKDDDVVTVPYDGVTHVTGERHGWKFTIQGFDPAKVRYEVVHPDPMDIATNVAEKYNALLVYNGGEWDKISKPKDYSVSNGVVYVPRNELVPSLMILNNGTLRIDHREISNVKHAISGLRYLVQDRVVKSYLYGTEPKYTEGHSRSIDGLNADGHHMRLTSEGAYPNEGMTLLQVAEIMIEYGAVVAFDEGGGGDSTAVMNFELINTPENPGGVQRYLPQFLLVYAENGDDPMPSEYRYEAVSSSRISIRADHSVYADRLRTEDAGVVMMGDELWVAPADGDLVKRGDSWLNLGNGEWVAVIHLGRRYCTLKDNGPIIPPPSPDPGSEKRIVSILESKRIVVLYDDGTQDVFEDNDHEIPKVS
ncbi:MAG TPA: GH25 family lysozyme [Anaerolineales bacterium]